MTVKEKILASAAEIASNEGVLALTLDRVAAHAEVSKGGLLYHFPNKEALVEALVLSLMENFDQNLSKHIEAGASLPEAYILATFDDYSSSCSVVASLIAGAFVDPSIVQIASQKTEEWHSNLVASGVSCSVARLIMLVGDGIMLNNAFGMSKLSEAEVAGMKKQLLDALKPSEQEQLAAIFRSALAVEEAGV